MPTLSFQGIQIYSCYYIVHITFTISYDACKRIVYVINCYTAYDYCNIKPISSNIKFKYLLHFNEKLYIHCWLHCWKIILLPQYLNIPSARGFKRGVKLYHRQADVRLPLASEEDFLNVLYRASL